MRTPLVLGHEFVGEVVGIGADVVDIKVGDLVSGEGHLVCGKCRNCLAGRRHLCRSTVGLGVGRDGAFAEYVALPASNVWVHRDQGRPRRRRDLRPVRQRRAHRAVLPAGRRGRADHRRRPDRHHGRRRRPPRRRPQRRHHRRQRGAAGTGQQDRGRPRPGRRRRHHRRRPAAPRPARGLRHRPGDVRPPRGHARHDREHDARRPDRHARTARRRVPRRLVPRSSPRCSPSRASTAARCTRPGTPCPSSCRAASTSPP